jgi:R3H domain
LQFYSQLLLFRDDAQREALIFPSTLSPQQRRIVHTLAHHMGLAHISRGNGEQRQVHVFRAPTESRNNLSPLISSMPTMHGESRRGLNRAATMDFSDARGSDPGVYGTLGRGSSALLELPGSPGGDAMNARTNLRAAKSFADLRSFTPSPVPSSASFPAALGNNIARFAEYGNGSVASTTPSLTPTATGTTMSGNRDDTLLVNGLGGMSLGGNLGVGGAGARDPHQQSALGGNRVFNMGYDGQSRDRTGEIPMRQPRGPAPERGPGFGNGRTRQNGQQNGRGSGELDVQSGVEIVVE